MTSAFPPRCTRRCSTNTSTALRWPDILDRLFSPSLPSPAAVAASATAGSRRRRPLVEAPETTFAFPPGLVAPSAYFSCSVTHFVCNCTVYRSNSAPQSTQLNRRGGAVVEVFLQSWFFNRIAAVVAHEPHHRFFYDAPFFIRGSRKYAKAVS